MEIFKSVVVPIFNFQSFKFSNLTVNYSRILHLYTKILQKSDN